PGDRIALQLPNLIQYPVALFGALRAGLVIVNTNPMYRPEEIEHQLNDAGAKALVVLTNVVASAAAVIERTPVELVILTDLADLHPPFSRHVINFVARYIKRMEPAIDLPSAISMRDVLQRGESLTLKTRPRSADDVAVIQYTGGTTGVAKGAM